MTRHASLLGSLPQRSRRMRVDGIGAAEGDGDAGADGRQPAAGTVMFTPNGDRVRVLAKVSGLAPGPHGFHIHEKGDCSAPDAASAGGHFNPTNTPHGNPSSGVHHGGDMPMLEADASGNATLDVTLDTVTLRRRREQHRRAQRRRPRAMRTTTRRSRRAIRVRASRADRLSRADGRSPMRLSVRPALRNANSRVARRYGAAIADSALARC